MNIQSGSVRPRRAGERRAMHRHRPSTSRSLPIQRGRRAATSSTRRTNRHWDAASHFRVGSTASAASSRSPSTGQPASMSGRTAAIVGTTQPRDSGDRRASVDRRTPRPAAGIGEADVSRLRRNESRQDDIACDFVLEHQHAKIPARIPCFSPRTGPSLKSATTAASFASDPSRGASASGVGPPSPVDPSAATLASPASSVEAGLFSPAQALANAR